MLYKILLISEFNKPWNNGWFYKNGFEKNGHEVVTLDPLSSGLTEDEVLEVAKKNRPGLIVHTKDELPPNIFQQLRKIAKVVMWYPDPVIPEWMPPYVQAADIFFTMTEGLLEGFRKYNPQTYWLTQAFEPSFFSIKNIRPEDVEAFAADVTFVGNLGSKEQYLIRRRYLSRVIKEGVKLRWWGPRIPRKLSTASLLFGSLGRAYGGRFIWGEEYAKAARLSKIFLAFDSFPELRKSMSARMYTAVGCGAFYMCRHVEGIEEVLVPDKEIVTFHNEQEMIEKIRFYLRHEDARNRIAKAGETRVLKDHTYEVRISEMVKVIEHSGIL